MLNVLKLLSFLILVTHLRNKCDHSGMSRETIDLYYVVIDDS